MHHAARYIEDVVFTQRTPSSSICAHVLHGHEAKLLLAKIARDSYSYIYSSLISLAEGIRGIGEGQTTWATVKLYYSVFYAARCILALNGRCFFYIARKPYSVVIRAGESPAKERGQTHKIVLKAFEHSCPEPFFFSQPIENQSAVEWLMAKREEANYIRAKFAEPNASMHVRRIIESGVRLAINAYLTKGEESLMFDPDHAILAYPVRLVRWTIDEVKRSGNWAASPEEKRYLRTLFRDKRGPLPQLYNIFA